MSISYLKNKSKTLKNNIFNESLKIYLDYNDEPVWVDNSDTLDVIKWVVDNKIRYNKPPSGKNKHPKKLKPTVR